MIKYLTIAQTSEAHPAFSQSSLRNIITKAHDNGFNSVIKRVNTRVLIEESAFIEWIEVQQNG